MSLSSFGDYPPWKTPTAALFTTFPAPPHKVTKAYYTQTLGLSAECWVLAERLYRTQVVPHFNDDDKTSSAYKDSDKLRLWGKYFYPLILLIVLASRHDDEGESDTRTEADEMLFKSIELFKSSAYARKPRPESPGTPPTNGGGVVGGVASAAAMFTPEENHTAYQICRVLFLPMEPWVTASTWYKLMALFREFRKKEDCATTRDTGIRSRLDGLTLGSVSGSWRGTGREGGRGAGTGVGAGVKPVAKQEKEKVKEEEEQGQNGLWSIPAAEKIQDDDKARHPATTPAERRPTTESTITTTVGHPVPVTKKATATRLSPPPPPVPLSIPVSISRLNIPTTPAKLNTITPASSTLTPTHHHRPLAITFLTFIRTDPQIIRSIHTTYPPCPSFDALYRQFQTKWAGLRGESSSESGSGLQSPNTNSGTRRTLMGVLVPERAAKSGVTSVWTSVMKGWVAQQLLEVSCQEDLEMVVEMAAAATGPGVAQTGGGVGGGGSGAGSGGGRQRGRGYVAVGLS